MPLRAAARALGTWMVVLATPLMAIVPALSPAVPTDAPEGWTAIASDTGTSLARILGRGRRDARPLGAARLRAARRPPLWPAGSVYTRGFFSGTLVPLCNGISARCEPIAVRPAWDARMRGSRPAEQGLRQTGVGRG